MCSSGFDCKWCAQIEVCPKVRAAFPTKAEEDAVKSAKKSKAGKASYQRGSWFRQKPDVAGAKPCAICKTEPRVSGSYCETCNRAKSVAYYAENAERIRARKRKAYVGKKSARRLAV